MGTSRSCIESTLYSILAFDFHQAATPPSARLNLPYLHSPTTEYSYEASRLKLVNYRPIFGHQFMANLVISVLRLRERSAKLAIFTSSQQCCQLVALVRYEASTR